MTREELGRQHALAIWRAAVAAVRPDVLVQQAVATEDGLREATRILVVGAGKAGPSMVRGLEAALQDRQTSIEGLVNVPAGATTAYQHIRLHAARAQGVNEPTEAGVAGAQEMLALLRAAGPDDVAICLLSGGGSALLPAPVPGVSFADKLAITKLLHRCGATINEMNCVRKHISQVKGGRLSEAFRGKFLLALIISDVVGDPLDVIASGPTAPDPTTFEEARAILACYHLTAQAPPSVVWHLEKGCAGEVAETPKFLAPNTQNRVIGNNRLALDAAKDQALELGYRVLDLGAFIEGETRHVAIAVAGIIRSIRSDRQPLAPPVCLLMGGETTVTLQAQSGRGGRNQEFVLAVLEKLGGEGIEGVTVLSAGTDGEDGPTDAAGAVADAQTWFRSRQISLSARDYLNRHDAYNYFDLTESLMKTGLTGTNVMDARIILVR